MGWKKSGNEIIEGALIGWKKSRIIHLESHQANYSDVGNWFSDPHIKEFFRYPHVGVISFL